MFNQDARETLNKIFIWDMLMVFENLRKYKKQTYINNRILNLQAHLGRHKTKKKTKNLPKPTKVLSKPKHIYIYIYFQH
jgi:hypothetical protein